MTNKTLTTQKQWFYLDVIWYKCAPSMFRNYHSQNWHKRISHLNCVIRQLPVSLTVKLKQSTNVTRHGMPHAYTKQYYQRLIGDTLGVCMRPGGGHADVLVVHCWNQWVHEDTHTHKGYSYPTQTTSNLGVIYVKSCASQQVSLLLCVQFL